MTTPTPTQAELEAAKAIALWASPDFWENHVDRIAHIIAAHRAAPPVTLAPTFNLDPTHDDKIARQHEEALNQIGNILIGLQNEAIERARSVFEDQPSDPAQAHAAELEMELKHIQEMAAEDIRMGDASGAIWQIEANARSMLAKLAAERKAAQVTP